MNESFRIALAGNPNTGKSTLFNALTGLKQHTGNWAGKTVEMKEGIFHSKGRQYRMIDLPGTYSLYANSTDEEVARNYIIFEKPDITIVVVDATAFERNLNLALQVLEMMNQVIICINLIDEAEKLGIKINEYFLMKRLGVPVIKISARTKQGFTQLIDTIDRMISGVIPCDPIKLTYDDETEEKIRIIEGKVRAAIGEKYPPRWIALRLLDGDRKLLKELQLKLVNEEVTS